MSTGSSPARTSTSSSPARTSTGSSPARMSTGSSPARTSTSSSPARMSTGSSPVRTSTSSSPARMSTGSSPARTSTSSSPARMSTGSSPARTSTSSSPARMSTGSSPARTSTGSVCRGGGCVDDVEASEAESTPPSGVVTGLLSSASLMTPTLSATSSSASLATNQRIWSARALTVNCNCATSNGVFMAAICAVDVDGIGAVSRSQFAVTVLAVLPTATIYQSIVTS